MTDFTEYTTFRYLRQHQPDIPIPKPLGVLRFVTRTSLQCWKVCRRCRITTHLLYMLTRPNP
ncbi:hypothetical protein BJX65DRAFT_262873 [Aspergillus insuetus]